MTTFEHAALGSTLALVLGAQRRAGWAVVGMAAVAGALPDWDGMSLLLGGTAFARVHRVWGHNLLVAGVSGAFVGGIGYLWRRSLLAQRLTQRFWPEPSAGEQPAFATRLLALWIVMGALASLSHLPADIVFSGHPDMRSWPVPIYWPFSEDGWVWPLVAWGDPVPTLIFVAAMFALFRWRIHGQVVALATLVCVHVYLTIRWLAGGVGS